MNEIPRNGKDTVRHDFPPRHAALESRAVQDPRANDHITRPSMIRSVEECPSRIDLRRRRSSYELDCQELVRLGDQ